MTEDTDATSLRARLAELQQQTDRDQQRLEQEVSEQTESRSRITRLVLWTYVVGLSVAGLLALAEAWQTKDFGKAAGNLIEWIKVLVLPLVTLALGYYFGRGGKG